MGMLHRYALSGTVTYHFTAETLAPCEGKAMDDVTREIDYIADVNLKDPDVAFDRVEDIGLAKRGGSPSDDPDRW